MVSFVLLAGGKGKRLFPITKETPKPTLELLGRKLYEYTLGYAAKAGIREALIVTRDGWIDRINDKQMIARIAVQNGYGIDNAIKTFYESFSHELDDTTIIAFTGFIARPEDIIEQSLNHYTLLSESNMIMVAPVVSGTETHITVEFEMGKRVKRVREQGSGGSGYALAGILVLNREGVRALYENGLVEGLNLLAAQGSLGAALWTGEWMDISYPWDILEAVAVLLEGVSDTVVKHSASVSKNAIIEGPVVIDEGARVDDFAVIRGPAYIGKNVLVGMGAFVRQYTTIESYSIVGSRVELKRSVVMRNSELSTGVVIADSVVGPNSRIGEFTVAKSTYVEKLPSRITGRVYFRKRKPKMGSIIGESTRLEPHTVIPPGSIIE